MSLLRKPIVFPGRAAFPCIRVTLDSDAPVGPARPRPREVGGKKLGGEDGAAEGCCRLRECARPEAVRARGYDVLIAVVRSPWPVAARRKHHGAAA